MDFNLDELLRTLFALESDDGFVPTDGRFLDTLLLIHICTHLCSLVFEPDRFYVACRYGIRHGRNHGLYDGAKAWEWLRPNFRSIKEEENCWPKGRVSYCRRDFSTSDDPNKAILPPVLGNSSHIRCEHEDSLPNFGFFPLGIIMRWGYFDLWWHLLGLGWSLGTMLTIQKGLWRYSPRE